MTRLYLTMIRPIMEYSPILMALASRMSILKMQRVQNHALKMVVSDTEDRYMTLKNIHEKYRVEAMNVWLPARLAKTWERATIPEIG